MKYLSLPNILICIYKPKCELRLYKSAKKAHIFVSNNLKILHRSTLIRTVHSIVKRTPPHLLEEIVLLDDASNKEHLGQKLDDYMAK